MSTEEGKQEGIKNSWLTLYMKQKGKKEAIPIYMPSFYLLQPRTFLQSIQLLRQRHNRLLQFPKLHSQHLLRLRGIAREMTIRNSLPRFTNWNSPLFLRKLSTDNICNFLRVIRAFSDQESLM